MRNDLWVIYISITLFCGIAVYKEPSALSSWIILSIPTLILIVINIGIKVSGVFKKRRRRKKGNASYEARIEKAKSVPAVTKTKPRFGLAVLLSKLLNWKPKQVMQFSMAQTSMNGGAGGDGDDEVVLDQENSDRPRRKSRKNFPWMKFGMLVLVVFLIAAYFFFFREGQQRADPMSASMRSMQKHPDTVTKQSVVPQQLVDTTAAISDSLQQLRKQLFESVTAKHRTDSMFQVLQKKLDTAGQAERQLAERQKAQLAQEKKRHYTDSVKVDSLKKAYDSLEAKKEASPKKSDSDLVGNDEGNDGSWVEAFVKPALKFLLYLFGLVMAIIWFSKTSMLSGKSIDPKKEKSRGALIILGVAGLVAGGALIAYHRTIIVELASYQKKQVVDSVVNYYKRHPVVIRDSIPYADPVLATKVTLLQQQNKTLLSENQALIDQFNTLNATLQSAGKVAADTINVLRTRLAASKPPVIDSGRIHEIFALREKEKQEKKAKEKQPEETKPKSEEKKDKKAKKNVPSKDKTEFGVPNDRTQ
jgi:hypothetical protein